MITLTWLILIVNLQNTVKKENTSHPQTLAHVKMRQVQAQPPVEQLSWGCGNKKWKKKENKNTCWHSPTPTCLGGCWGKGQLKLYQGRWALEGWATCFLHPCKTRAENFGNKCSVGCKQAISTESRSKSYRPYLLLGLRFQLTTPMNLQSAKSSSQEKEPGSPLEPAARQKNADGHWHLLEVTRAKHHSQLRRVLQFLTEAEANQPRKERGIENK